jgi:carbon storage regulator CsrA
VLVLTRKLGEKIIIDGNITLTVVEVRGKGVGLGIDAPKAVRILREELVGQGYQPWADDENDPDLEGKPTEWEEATPSPVLAG